MVEAEADDDHAPRGDDKNMFIFIAAGGIRAGRRAGPLSLAARPDPVDPPIEAVRALAIRAAERLQRQRCGDMCLGGRLDPRGADELFVLPLAPIEEQVAEPRQLAGGDENMPVAVYGRAIA